MAKRTKHQLNEGLTMRVTEEGELVLELADGTRIARREPDGKGGGFWVTLHPNYSVFAPPDNSYIDVGYSEDKGSA
jgi:hypothetical protein